MINNKELTPIRDNEAKNKKQNSEISNGVKILFISFFISLPFWWGVNIFADKTESFFFWQAIVKNPQILTAQADASYKFFQAKKEREEERLKSFRVLNDNLAESTKSVISVEVGKSGNERILFEKNSQEVLPIASLTKLMTALVVFDIMKNDFPRLVEIKKEAVSQDGASKYGDLKEGEYFSVETLLNIMLIESSNDAAYALADVIGQEGFVELMNIYAKDIGLKNTKFFNPNGLEPNNPAVSVMNLSTSRDIVKLAEYILEKYPKIFEITTKVSYEAFNPDGTLHHFIPENTNQLLPEISNIIGGKTGWSPKANGCLLVVLKNPGRDSYIINVILGANDRFEEMRKLIRLADQ